MKKTRRQEESKVEKEGLKAIPSAAEGGRTCWVPEVPDNPIARYYASNRQGAQPLLSVLVPLSFTPEDIVARDFGFDHRSSLTCFGGVRPWLRRDEEWPRCGHCDNHFQFLFQIDFRFLPAEAARQFAGNQRNRLLQMFMCPGHTEFCQVWEPFDKSVLLRFVPLPPAGGPTLLALASRSLADSLDSRPDKETVMRTLRLIGLDTILSASADIAANEDTSAQLAKYPRADANGNCTFDFALPFHRPVRWTERQDWPSEEELADGRRVVKQNRDQHRPTYEGTKVGGWPCHCARPQVWAVKYPACRECGAAMTNLVFHISEDDVILFDWGDSAPHIVLQCPAHYAEMAFMYLA